MNSILVTVAPEATRVRLLAMTPQGEVMRAVLGPAARMHPRAATTLLEGLALWQQQPLSVVLYADVSGDGCAMGLLDALGGGVRTLHYEVEVALRHSRRSRRLGGVGNFRDLRQLAFAGQGTP
jgi:hypothetical protein